MIALSRSEFPRTLAAIEEGVSQEVAPGFVVGLWEKCVPHQIQVTAAGNRRILPSSLPMGVESVFDLASISKVIATATLAAVLVERRWLSWDTPVSALIDQYPYPEIRIKHLLSHTAGFTAWEPFWQKLRERFAPHPLNAVSVLARQRVMRELVFSVRPVHPSEVIAVYSDLSFLTLGFALEEATGLSLDQAVMRNVWIPMGITGAHYRGTRKDDERIVATENCPWRGTVLQGQVHDDNCWAMGGYGGHAGVFGSVRDVLYFAKRLVEGFLSPEVMTRIWSRTSLPKGCDRTMGWDTPSGDHPASGPLFSRHSIGHLGFTGTSLWIDPEAELAVALLSNRVHPTRENIKIREFRPKLHEAIRLDIKHRKSRT